MAAKVRETLSKDDLQEQLRIMEWLEECDEALENLTSLREEGPTYASLEMTFDVGSFGEGGHYTAAGGKFPIHVFDDFTPNEFKMLLDIFKASIERQRRLLKKQQ